MSELYQFICTSVLQSTQKNTLNADDFQRVLTVSSFFENQLQCLLNKWVDLNPATQNFWHEWVCRWVEPFDESWFTQFLDRCFQDPAIVSEELRLLRLCFQLRAVFREVTTLPEDHTRLCAQMSEYSLFADQVLARSLSYVHNNLAEEWSLEQPLPAMIIIALGKLGANELNLSSDVDLIFGYSAEAEIKNDIKQREAQEFYTRLAQRFIKLMNDTHEGGFVFRIDMRLRPYGQSGALVWSDEALENYYEQQGRMWERYAWIKARIITGGAIADSLLHSLAPFVYRRYIDFGAIESLREMKRLIEREVKRTEADRNIKIGLGGIREVEFIVQVVQLIQGGELFEIRQPSLMNAFESIKSLDLLPESVVNELRSDYLYLRHIEHLLQAVNDQQTQMLPALSDTAAMERLVFASRVTSIEAFEIKIREICGRIHYHFLNTIGMAQPEWPEKDVAQWRDFWVNDRPIPRMSVDQAEHDACVVQLEEFKHSKILTKASDIAQARLHAVMPMIMAVIAELHPPEAKEIELASLSYQLKAVLPELEFQWPGRTEILRRVLQIVEAVLRRSAYLSLLFEKPQALEYMVKVCGLSILLAELIAAHPSLLEECIDVDMIVEPPTHEQLADELRQHLMRVPQEDIELQMARLRAFKQRHILRAGAADAMGQLPLMKVSDYLTWLAEVLLSSALEIAWQQTVNRFGLPSGIPEGAKGFLVVGYGKLGGIELSYTSDLDIVCLYHAPEDGETEGPKVVENSVFYIRLVRTLNHVLMTDTLDGRLYEVDMRLRPSGHSGLFVSTFEGFHKYQKKNAWVWEQQALVRARPVAGDGELFLKFETLRKECLHHERTHTELRKDVFAMRNKLAIHNRITRIPKEQIFDLKYDSGGMIDIEFLAQYLVLAFAQQHKSLMQYTDNIRIFDAAERENIITIHEGQRLRRAYLICRALMHRLSLENKPAILPIDILNNIRVEVKSLFEKYVNAESYQ